MPYKDPEKRNAKARERYQKKKKDICAYMREYRILRRKNNPSYTGSIRTYRRTYNRTIPAIWHTYKTKCKRKKEN